MRCQLLILFLLSSLFCKGQNFGHIIDDVVSEDEKGISLEVEDDDFFVINTASGGGIYKYNVNGEIQWRNFYPQWSMALDSYIVLEDSLRFVAKSATSADMDFENYLIESQSGIPVSVDTHLIHLSSGFINNFEFLRTFGSWGILNINDRNITGGRIHREGSSYSQGTIAIQSESQDEWFFRSAGSSDKPKAGQNNDIFYFEFPEGSFYDFVSIYRFVFDSNQPEFYGSYDINYPFYSSYNILPFGDSYVISESHFQNYIIERFDYDRNSIWRTSIETSLQSGVVNKMIECLNGDISVATNNTELGQSNGISIMLSRLTSDGDLLWERIYDVVLEGDPVSTNLDDIIELNDGRLLCSGSGVKEGEVNRDMILFTLDSNGCFTDENCTTIELEQEQIEYNLEVEGFVTSSLACESDTTNSVLLEVNFGVPPYTYELIGSHIQSEPQFVNLPSGDLQFRIEDNQGSAADLNVYVQSNPPIEVSYLQEFGTIELIATGGTAAFTYSIDGGQTFQSDSLFENLAVGDYEVVVKDSFGCVSEVIQVSIQPCTGQWTTQATDLIVQCDQEETYQSQVNEWIDNQAGLVLTTECDEVSYTNDWNGSYDSGNYWITFTASGVMSSLEYSRGGFMSIQRGDSAPVITTDASDLSVVSNTLDIDLIIQQWLNSQGGAEAIDNCGSITWSHNYNLDLTPGEHVVMFKATSDIGVASETSATLTIELASSSEDIIEQNALHIYPNPSNGEFSIILEEDNHLRSKIEVFNPLGEIIFFTTLDKNVKIHQLNLSHIDNGIYVVKLSNLLGEKSSILVKY